MIQTALRKILNSFGDKNYQHGRGMLYFAIETLGSKASEDRQFLDTMDFTGKTIYDVGAYIGLLTVFFAKKVGAKGTVIAFEPNPESFSKLLINTDRYPNVTPLNLGAGNKYEKLNLVASAHSRATGTVEHTMTLERTTRPHREWSVQVVPLDSLQSLPPPHFVKIDVEGFEYSVLEGMKNTILSHRPTLFIEIHGVTNAMKKRNMQKIIGYLHNFNYELFHIETHQRVSSSYIPLTGHVLAYFSIKQQVIQSKPRLRVQ